MSSIPLEPPLRIRIRLTLPEKELIADYVMTPRHLLRQTGLEYSIGLRAQMHKSVDALVDEYIANNRDKYRDPDR